MKWNRSWSLLVSITLALSSLACGGQEGEQETVREMAPAADPPAAATSAPPAKPLPPGASEALAKIDPEALRRVADAHRKKLQQHPLGARIEITADGAPIELPEDYPVDVPIHPNGVATRYIASKAGGAMTEIEVTDSSPSVRTFFVREMASEGWLIDSDESREGFTVIRGSKDDRELFVTIRASNGVSQVVVVEGY